MVDSGFCEFIKDMKSPSRQGVSLLELYEANPWHADTCVVGRGGCELYELRRKFKEYCHDPIAYVARLEMESQRKEALAMQMRETLRRADDNLACLEKDVPVWLQRGLDLYDEYISLHEIPQERQEHIQMEMDRCKQNIDEAHSAQKEIEPLLRRLLLRSIEDTLKDRPKY